MSAATTRPFPWSSLEATSHAEVSALREMRLWVAQRVRPDAFAHALEGIVGADVRVRVGRATPLSGAAGGRALEGGLGVVLSPADDEAKGGAALLQVEPALAGALLARVLKRPPLLAVNLSAPPSAAIAGGFAAVVVAAARRATSAQAPLRVVSVGEATALEADFVRGELPAMALSVTVLVGDDAYASRLVLRRARPFSVPPPEWTVRSLASLGEMSLSLPIVACATPAQVADVAALRRGDAWLPGTWPLDLARDARDHGGRNGSLRGPVLLAAPSAAAGVRARLVDGGRLVLSGEVDAVCAVEVEMTEADGEGALLGAVGDVPVVVRVEIGEARMAAREWASLGRGDVVTLGRRVGELVLLRVGGVAVARGELVSVDGEVGVRIAERIAGDKTTA